MPGGVGGVAPRGAPLSRLRAPAHPTIIVLGMGVLRPWLAEVVSAGHMVLSAVGGIRRNMASGRGRRPDVPNAVIAGRAATEGAGSSSPVPAGTGFR